MKNHSKTLIFILTAALFFSCGANQKDPIEKPIIDQSESIVQSAETIEMAQELQRLASSSNPELNIYLNTQRCRHFQQIVEQRENTLYDPAWFDYCTELMRSGNPRQCIIEIEAFFNDTIPLQNQIHSNDDVLAIELLAIANLRMGEEENCQNLHTEFSCILPLQAPAFHQLKEGSSRAIELYQMIEDYHPQPFHKWLINLAYMTLGEYPNNVPDKYKIDFPNWDLETKNFPRFKEIGMNVDAAIDGLSGGTCVEDFNNDGLLDIFMTGYGLTEQARLLVNNGKGSFDDKTSEAGINGIIGGLNCIQADYNNDGYLDIFILRGAWLESIGNFPNSLLKNNGDGTFSDVTKSAGLLSYHPTQTASWADYDRDGFVDLFIGNETSPGAVNPCEFYRNNGDGTFSEISDQVGLGGITKFVKGVSFGDIDNDNFPDLYISVLGDKNLLFKNEAGQFKNIAGIAGVEEPIESFPCWFWDVNNDGLQDLFVSGYDMAYANIVPDVYAKELLGEKTGISTPRLYINNGDNTFKEMHKAYNIDRAMYPMGCNFGDLDNDGYLDFYLGTGCPDYSAVIPNRMFRNVDGKRFEEVTSAGGFGHIQKGHAIAFGDIDMDGDQDIYAVMGGAYDGDNFTNVLFENPGFKKNWIVVSLEGTKTNSAAIGTRIELILDNGQKIYHIVGSGASFGSSSIQGEIGLGDAKIIKTMNIYWQNSEMQTFNDISINQKIKIVEGETKFETKSYNHIPFSTQGKGHHQH